MKTSATNRRVRVLLTAINESVLVPQPDFQRRLVWRNKDKVAFIETVLAGYPFPEIYIAAGTVDPETGKGTELLVDGQQRITTLLQYFKGSKDIKLPKSVVSYADLPEAKKLEFLEYEVVVRDLGSMDLQTIKDVFVRINSTNYALNAMEVHNARFDGEFKQFGETVADSDFFKVHSVFSASEIRRMQDVKYCITVAVTILSAYFNRDSELESFLERFDELFPDGEKLYRQISEGFTLINDLALPSNSRAWKKVDLFTLLVEVNRLRFKRGVKPDVRAIADRLNAFYTSVDRVSSGGAGDEITSRYHQAALQATNDRGSRLTRGEILQSVLDPTYKPQLG